MRTNHLAISLAVFGLWACGQDDRNHGSGPGGAGSACADESGPDAFALRVGEDDLGTAAQILAERGLPTGLTAHLVERGTSEGAEHFVFAFHVQGVPLCVAALQVHYVAGRWLVNDGLGKTKLASGAWADPALSFDAESSVLDRAQHDMGAHLGLVSSSRRCVLVEQGEPRAAVDLMAQLDGRPYRIVGSGAKVTLIDPQWFGATGEARVYKSGPHEGELINVPLADLDDGARLKSARFETALEASLMLAESDDRKYVYDPTDPRFVEVSAFTNAERMAAWFTKPEHDYTLRCMPIIIRPHYIFKNPYTGETTVNNAEYVPPEWSDTGSPEIHMGDGDGINLVNIGVDFDAVAHELGHHILYKRLKSHSGEAGVLHEGVADFFVFAATGNACLGESLCPEGSAACARAGACLRTGDNAFRLDHSDLPPDAHNRSQLISGYLWDLGKTKGVDEIARIAMKSVDYLSATAGYKDFVNALMAADLELEGGVNSCAILQAAVDRGMAEALGDLSCATYVKTEP